MHRNAPILFGFAIKNDQRLAKFVDLGILWLGYLQGAVGTCASDDETKQEELLFCFTMDWSRSILLHFSVATN